MPSYPIANQWVPQYVVQAAAPIQQVDDYNMTATHMGGAYKSDGQPPRGIPVMLPSPESVPYNHHMIPQVRNNY